MESIESSIRANIERLRGRIEAAATRSGRRADEIRLMAVTKMQSRAVVEAGYLSGLRLFGENRLNEAEAKYRDFHGDAELHLIGHLQRNKARAAARLAACVESIDRPETALALDSHCRAEGRLMSILLEVNTSGEATKSGFASREALLDGLDRIMELEALRICGLMTIAPFTDDERLIRTSFRALRSLRDELVMRFPGLDWSELSMGMSNDFELAVEEGSTIVRIGTALFGERAKE